METIDEALELFQKQGWTVIQPADLAHHVPGRGSRADRVFACLLWDLVSRLRRAVEWEEATSF